MLAVPTMTRADMAFGNIDHLPKSDDIPDEYWRHHGNAYVAYVSEWFYRGRTQSDIDRLKARDGIDRNAALAAIKAVLSSFEPKHEHKTAGAAFLLHEWFELADAS